MNKSFCSPYQARAADKELVSVLTAISIVSNRLARNIALLAGQSQSEEGGKAYANASEAPWGYTYEPSAEEIDQAMLKEAQEAEMNQHDYWNESHCYPFF